MRENTRLTYSEVDHTVLNTLSPPSGGYWLLIMVLILGVLFGAACWTYQFFTGIGVGGQNNPVAWGIYLVNFVFWVGIAHSGTLISAILHLLRAGWRNPIARPAETMTVFAVMIAGLFPFIHLGRVWVVYYMLPYPNQRNLSPNFQSQQSAPLGRLSVADQDFGHKALSKFRLNILSALPCLLPFFSGGNSG